MLKEIIEESKGELAKKIERHEALGIRIEKMEQEREKAESEIRELKKEVRALRKYNGYNAIRMFFVKHFSKNYKIDMKNMAKNEVLIAELTNKVQELNKEEKRSELEKQAIDSKGAKEELEKMQDEKYAIKKIINKNSELTSNKEFMKELIQKDLRYLKYDTSDKPSLYREYIVEVMKKVESIEIEDGMEFQKDYAMSIGKKIIEEIDKPKEVEEGKYKIPQKYLFEALRNPNIKGEYEKDVEKNILYAGEGYLNSDGEYSIEYGKEMENLYNDKDNYLLMHKINCCHGLNVEEMLDIRDSIYNEGLRSTVNMGNAMMNQLQKTTLGNYQDGCIFMNFLLVADKMLIKLPKKAIGKDSNTPVWGSDLPEATNESPGYLLPEYIYGYINPRTEKIEKNPIPIEERKKYKYKFLEGHTKCMEELTRED